jgi:carbon storage regulator
MLVLSRKLGERVWIGDDVIVQVVDIRDGRVVLGFEAPLEIEIDREEIGQRKREGRVN